MSTGEKAVEARAIRGLFDGRRLRLAREIRGYSQQELGRLAGNISGTAISQFERGDSKPSARTLVDLATALRFPPRFFRRDAPEEVGGSAPSFRSLRATAASHRRQARAFVALVHELAVALERLVELPRLDVPRFNVADTDGREHVESVAESVRQAWAVPSGPIDDVVRLVERRGIIVTRTSFEDDSMDAFSVRFDDRPVVVLCSDKGKRDRSRFDAAHELGHLVMHEGASDPGKVKMRERQAHQFAAAFLMPAGDIEHELPSTADWERLLVLKRRWGVSIASLLYRGRTLGTMREDIYVRATRALSARGWRIDEPGDLGAPESPVLLRSAVTLLVDRGFRIDQIAGDAGLPADQIDRILEAVGPTRLTVVL